MNIVQTLNSYINKYIQKSLGKPSVLPVTSEERKQLEVDLKNFIVKDLPVEEINLKEPVETFWGIDLVVHPEAVKIRNFLK